VTHAGHTHDLPHVVVVGAGFGGLSAAAHLAGAPARVTLIDRRNHHLFQPLLYQVATAGLAPTQIATPIRTIVRNQTNVDVVLGEVTGVDTARREVMLNHRRLGYDYLVLATGARHAYFGRDAWEGFAPGLKTLDDATEHRRRILLAFEGYESACTAVTGAIVPPDVS
jgi:NADH:ubiquinone reductase (H+-translocating)